MVATQHNDPTSLHSLSASDTALAAASVLDTQGAPVSIGELARDSTVLLVFVRHFGCMFCREQVKDILARRSELDALQVEPIIVGHGSVEEAAAFASEFAEGVRVFTDPERAAYCAAGMKRGLSTTLRVGVVGHAVRALIKGQRQGATQGDPLQQGGLVALRGKKVLYRFVSHEAGEHPILDDVIAALANRGSVAVG